MSTLVCPRCQSAPEARQVNLQYRVAYCGQCEQTFAISWPSGVKVSVPVPPQVKHQQQVSQLVIGKAWNRTTGWFMLAFGLFWGVLALYQGGDVSRHSDPDRVILSLIQSGILGLICLGLSYRALNYLLNTTVIEVNASEINIRATPLPVWNFNTRYPRALIRQLFCRQERRKHSEDVVYFELVAFTQHGGEVILMSDLLLEQARYYEQQIESFWQIQDHPMVGDA